MSGIDKPASQSSLPVATVWETLGVLADVLAPTVAKGVIIRRPRAVALTARLDLDRRAVRRLQRLRDRYGAGPLLLRLPVRRQAIILAPGHLRRVLDGTPEPFAAASSEKRAALAHFEPGGVLISSGPNRVERRRFNEAVLDTPRPIHHLGERFLRVVAEEAEALLGATQHEALVWDTFTAAWFRIVRRVVLGDAARDDQELTDTLARLRADANWAFLKPRRRALRQRFFSLLSAHLRRAESDSLAGVMMDTPASAATGPAQQVPQWLFAFDAAGIAIFRTLALLATHPAHSARAQEEIAAGIDGARGARPYLRASLLEALRLWPTTPAVLRQSTEATTWDAGVMPPQTGVLIFAQFFHRDDRNLPEANRFAPELWLAGRSVDDWPLIPFSAGPAICPGQNLVLFLSSALLAALLDGRQLRLLPPASLDPGRPLPVTLDHFALRFALGGAGDPNNERHSPSPW